MTQFSSLWDISLLWKQIFLCDLNGKLSCCVISVTSFVCLSLLQTEYLCGDQRSLSGRVGEPLCAEDQPSGRWVNTAESRFNDAPSKYVEQTNRLQSCDLLVSLELILSVKRPMIYVYSVLTLKHRSCLIWIFSITDCLFLTRWEKSEGWWNTEGDLL